MVGIWCPVKAAAYPDVYEFGEIVICDQCNAADGVAKRRLQLPQDFSFAPCEIREFIKAAPHQRHIIDLARASSLYWEIVTAERAAN